MTVVSNNFEGGSNGIAVTTGNSGGSSGTAFDAVFGTGLTYSSADATQGVMGASVAAGAIGAGQWNLSSVAHVAAKLKFTPKALATADTHLIRIHNGATRVFTVHINAAGKLRVDDATGTSGVFTFSNVLGVGTTYRLEAYVVAGSTTSNGTIKVAYYLGSSTTPVESAYVNTSANTGGSGTVFTLLYLGKYTTSPEAYGFDEFAYDTAATDFIGITTTPPTVSTPANQNVAATGAVSVSVTASSSSATIASYAWSFTYPTSGAPTLTGASTANASFTAGAVGNLYVLQCVVTDSNAVSTTVTTEVRVPTSGDATVLSGAASASVGSWSNVGGASTPADAVADTSDTTYVESATLGTTEFSDRFRLAPMTARSALNLTVRLAQDTSGSTTVKVRLFEGSTQRQQWTQAITTSFADYALSLTSPGAVTDWGNLYLEAAATSP